MRRTLARMLPVGAAIALLGAPAWAAGPASAHLARGGQGVFWFMHISDLHTSCEWDPTDEIKNQEFALGEAVQVIKPWFVVATGDLVDGSPNGIPTLGQSDAEWDKYKSIYTSAGMTPNFFFDLPGNHDGYGDVGYTHYLEKSLQGSTNHDTYVSWIVDTPIGSYLFVGLASAGEGSGPISEDPKFLPDQVAAMQAGIAQNPDAELVFVLAHHRITQPENYQPVVEALRTAGGGFYIHGHVHEYDEYTDGDPSIVVNEIDSLGQKESSNIGIGAVDHNAFVYRATGTETPWPLVMITAPVSTTLRNGETNPYAYRVCKDRTDNPVRALVFGNEPPSEVAVQIGTAPAASMTSAGNPPNLWSGEVDTSSLSAGPQEITVTAIVGGKPGFHKITAEFVDGPCNPLPEDPSPDAGADGGLEGGDDAGGSGGSSGDGGSGGSSAGGAGGAGAGGSSTAGAGGSVDAGAQAGSAGTAPAVEAESTTASDDGGCACEAAGAAPLRAWWMALVVAAVSAAARRRRSSRRPR